MPGARLLIYKAYRPTVLQSNRPTYMKKETLDRIQVLKAGVENAWSILNLDTKASDVAEKEKAQSAPDFWSDQERARRESQALADLKKEVDAWESLRSDVADVEELTGLAEEDASLEAEIEKKVDELEGRYRALEVSMLFSGGYDASNAILSIHAGAGGTDAQDWAEMLLRMFMRYAERKGWKVELVDETRGGEAGIKSATIIVSGRYAYGHLKEESGVHRLVRQSPFNADALRQTSFASVEVVPEIDDSVEVEIKPEDLRIDTFMSSGKGGQSVNTTYSAVRIVHLPTKITVSCQNERSQLQNKETAMKILRGKLVAIREAEIQAEKAKLKGEHKSAEWGNQIRSYVLHPYKMVKDHRTHLESKDPDDVLDGNLDPFIESSLKRRAEV